MPREHATINMTREELGRFLGSQTRCIVGTLDAEAGPWGDAAACVFQDEALYFRIPKKTRSLANLQRDSRVCCVIEDHPTGADYYTIKGAILHGRATAVAESATAQRVTSAWIKSRTPSPEGRHRMGPCSRWELMMSPVSTSRRFKRRFES